MGIICSGGLCGVWYRPKVSLTCQNSGDHIVLREFACRQILHRGKESSLELRTEVV